MIKKNPKSLVVLFICSTAILLNGGCTTKQRNNIGLPSPAPTSQMASMHVGNSQTYSKVRIYSDTSGQVWIPLNETAKSMNMVLHRTNDSFKMGDTDALYSVKINHTLAVDGDKSKELPHAPRFFDKKPYMTVQALSALIGVPVIWNDSNSSVVMTPIDDSAVSAQDKISGSQQPGLSSMGQSQSLGLGATKGNDIISFAEQFLGTPYLFAAGPYKSTHKFDCSSFVQYVYAHFGVSLPRGSRSQSQVGQSVDFNQLQIGDLMFFYTPGRYSSNRIVGHVGIYSGNNQMVNTYGKPGVTVTDINNYWKNRFLFAKRVL